MTKRGDEWDCEDCGDTQGRHDQWFDDICENCHGEKQDREKRNTIGNMLLVIFSSIGIDKPNNLDDIITFCVDDVEETADPDK